MVEEVSFCMKYNPFARLPGAATDGADKPIQPDHGGPFWPTQGHRVSAALRQARLLSRLGGNVFLDEWTEDKHIIAKNFEVLLNDLSSSLISQATFRRPSLPSPRSNCSLSKRS